MTEIHLKQPGFTCVACGPFTKHRERIQKFRKNFYKKIGPRISDPTKKLIKKFKRRKVYVRFKDNILAAGLAEMELLSSKNKNVKYLLCVIDIFTKKIKLFLMP